VGCGEILKPMGWVGARWGAAAIVGACVGAPSAALAEECPPPIDDHHHSHPRTPAYWEPVTTSCIAAPPEPTCIVRVDRSIDPVLHLDYAIPYEDVCPFPEEVPDSRRHEFFAFCRDRHAKAYLPDWIRWNDLAVTAQYFDIDPGSVSDDDVLESASDWQDCWTPLDAIGRRPITCESVVAGIDWDTSLLPIGAYVVDGFTWEPPYNIWSRRPGVVKVHDGDPDAAGPAVAVMTRDAIVYRDEPFLLEGCIDAAGGSTFSVYWALANTQDPVEVWMPLVTYRPVEGEAFAIELVPPPAMAGESGVLRVDVTDPAGLRSSGFLHGDWIVVNADTPTTPPDVDETESTSSAGASTGEPISGSGEQPEPEVDAPADGCGCPSSRPRWASWLLLLVAPVVRRRQGSTSVVHTAR